MVQPSGPSIQFGTCSASVNASKTSLRGASNTRVIATSLSEGVVNVVVPASFVVSMILLLHLLQVCVQPGVAGVPELSVVLGPLSDLTQRRRLEPARAPLSLPSPGDETCPLE